MNRRFPNGIGRVLYIAALCAVAVFLLGAAHADVPTATEPPLWTPAPRSTEAPQPTPFRACRAWADFWIFLMLVYLILTHSLPKRSSAAARNASESVTLYSFGTPLPIFFAAS